MKRSLGYLVRPSFVELKLSFAVNPNATELIFLFHTYRKTIKRGFLSFRTIST